MNFGSAILAALFVMLVVFVVLVVLWLCLKGFSAIITSAESRKANAETEGNGGK